MLSSAAICTYVLRGNVRKENRLAQTSGVLPQTTTDPPFVVGIRQWMVLNLWNPARHLVRVIFRFCHCLVLTPHHFLVIYLARSQEGDEKEHDHESGE
jgi:hypothetical protein